MDIPKFRKSNREFRKRFYLIKETIFYCLTNKNSNNNFMFTQSFVVVLENIDWTNTSDEKVKEIVTKRYLEQQKDFEQKNHEYKLRLETCRAAGGEIIHFINELLITVDSPDEIPFLDLSLVLFNL